MNTVLVIDDDAAVLGVIREMLNLRGIDVIVAADGASGIAAYREHAKDISAVILDIVLPDMDGLKAMKLLKSEMKGLRLVVCTGFGNQVVEERPDLAPTLLRKPFTTEQLYSSLALPSG